MFHNQKMGILKLGQKMNVLRDKHTIPPMTQLVLDRKGPILLVDGSYFIFHRFFATMKWYKFQHPETDGTECMAQEDFCEAIQKHAIADLAKIRKRCASEITGKPRISKKDWESIQVWFALDCPRGDIWRSKHIEGYKGTRDVARPMFDPRCFEVLLQRLGGEVPLLQTEGLEADDVVALTHRRLREIGYKDWIVCITNDHDYLQLLDGKTKIWNLEQKDLGSKSCGDPKKDLLCKILLGDKSDNIPPVRPRLKEKEIRERILEMSEEDLIASLRLTDEETSRMELHRTIIDFSRIPQDRLEAFRANCDISLL